MSEFRIKSAEGRWASSEPEQRAWISADMVELWRTAAKKTERKLAPELFMAIDLVEKLGFCKATQEVVMPMGPEQLAEVKIQEDKRREDFFKGQGHWSGKPTETEWQQNRAWQMRQIEYQVATKRQVQYVMAPAVSWASVPGDARMVDPNVARESIKKAQWALDLRKNLPRARAQCRKLGGEEHAWLEPLFDKPGIGTQELTQSSCVEFRAAEEFEDKKAVAIYVDNGVQKGFVDKRGSVKNDIAEACLFPSQNKALAFSRRYIGECMAVEVVISAVSYKPLMGSGGGSTDLAAVIASRERREIEKVLELVKLEELEAELAKRRLDAGVAEPKTEEATKRKQRL
jgi:hypothetical protein